MLHATRHAPFMMQRFHGWKLQHCTPICENPTQLQTCGDAKVRASRRGTQNEPSASGTLAGWCMQAAAAAARACGVQRCCSPACGNGAQQRSVYVLHVRSCVACGQGLCYAGCAVTATGQGTCTCPGCSMPSSTEDHSSAATSLALP